MKELLSISIPTRNRSKYLKELLHSIKVQFEKNNCISDFVKIYIFDNVSNDDTFEVVKTSGLDIIYKKNNQNIGGGRNIFQAYTSVKGQYVWVIGDDELIPENTIDLILQLINIHHPHLIINKDSSYKTFVELPLTFPSYSDFAKFAQAHNPHLLIAHSLISTNIILKSCYDADFAHQKKHTHYCHFYGVIKGLKNSPGKIVIPEKPTLIIRDRRAEAHIERIYPVTVDDDQVNYLEWVSKEYSLENLVPRKVVPDYIRKVFFYEIKRHPIKATIKMIFDIYNELFNNYPSCRPILNRIKYLYIKVTK